MEYRQLHEIENVNLLCKLLDKGLDPNAFDNYGLTPLHYCESPEVAEILLSRGADPTLRSKNKDFVSALELCHNKDAKRIMLDYIRNKSPLNFTTMNV